MKKLSLLDAIDNAKGGKIRFRRSKYKLKEYIYDNDYKVYVINNRYTFFLNQYIDKKICKYMNNPLICNILEEIKEDIKKEFKNTWVEVKNFSIEETLANDWEIIK
jgi:hypothetical protein